MSFERFEGVIHDRVGVGTEAATSATVIAGCDSDDTLSVQVHASGVSMTLALTSIQAKRLGLLLVAAAHDTESR